MDRPLAAASRWWATTAGSASPAANTAAARSVQRPALLVAQRLERRFAEQVVDERPRDDARGALDHPRRRGAVERAGDVGDGELEHRAQLRRCERAPEHRRGDENRPVTGRERREAAGEQVARTGREPAARQRGRIGSEQAPELDDQERVATGAPLDLLRGAFRALPAQRPAQQCRDPAPVEAVQRHTVGRRAQPCERRTREHLRVAVRGDDEDGKGRELSGHRREQTDGALVGPVQVVEHDDVCTLGGRRLECRGDRRIRGRACGARGRGVVDGRARELRERRLARRAQPGEDAEPWPVRDGCTTGPARRPTHGHARAPRPVGEVARHRRLPDAGFTGEHDHRAVTPPGAFERLAQGCPDADAPEGFVANHALRTVVGGSRRQPGSGALPSRRPDDRRPK